MKRSLKVGAWALLASLSLLLIACGPAQGTEDEAVVEATQLPATAVGQESEPPAPVDLPAEPVIGELEYIEIEAGDGPMAELGDRVSVHYTGMLEDGSV